MNYQSSQTAALESHLLRQSVISLSGGVGKGSESGGKLGDGSGGRSGADPDYEASLIAVAQEMAEKVEVKDRSYHFKSYKNCFIGKEAVKFLVWSGRAANIAEALALGNALMQRGIFGHVTNDHSFKNEDLFYRFNYNSIPQKGLAGSVRAAGGYSSSSLESGLVPQRSAPLGVENRSTTIESYGRSTCLSRMSIDNPEVLESRIAAVGKQLQENLPVKDRFWHLKTHKSCFNGKEAVKWLVENGHAGTENEATAIGNALLQRRTFLAVTGETAFKNDDTLFRFRMHDEVYLSGLAWLSTSGLSQQMTAVVRDLLQRLDVRDRPGRLVPHKLSFIGKEAVACLIVCGHAKSSEDAVALGNALLNLQAIISVTGDYPFRDEDLLYRFQAHDESSLPKEPLLVPVGSVATLKKLGWGTTGGQGLTDEELEGKLQEVAKAMVGGLEVKDRSWHLKVYKKCFTGRDGVKFLMDNGFASSIDIALMVGNALLVRGIFGHVTGEHTFKNEELFYRFKVHDKDVRKGLHWLSKSRGLDAKMEEAARAMMAKLSIRSRTHNFKRHRKCFVGRDAIQFLIRQGFAENAEAAVELGNGLMDKGVFSHVNGDQAFKNEASMFYRFSAHNDMEDKGVVKVGAVRRLWKSNGQKGRGLASLSRRSQDEYRAFGGGQGEGGMGAAAVRSWRSIMAGLNELAISQVGLDPVLGAVELVGRDSVATGLLHWGITHVVLALSFLEDALRAGCERQEAVAKADDLLGRAGQRCNEALAYKPDLFRAAMMIAAIHHLRAAMHAGLLALKETVAFFNTCLASGGVLALDSGESAAVISLSAVLEEGEDEPFNHFLALQAANLSSTQPKMKATTVMAADVHFQSAVRVLEALLRMLPKQTQKVKRPSFDVHLTENEEGRREESLERSTSETVCGMWGMLLWDKSQIWAAVGRPWKALLDQAVDKLRLSGAQEADIDLLVAFHIMMQEP